MFFTDTAAVLLMISLVLGVPVVIGFMRTGLVPRLPTVLPSRSPVQSARSSGAFLRWRERVALQRAVLLLTLVLSALVWRSLLTDAPIEKDGAQNLQMALNLKETGTISGDEPEIIDPSRPRDTPTMYREPLPAVIGLLTVHVIDAMLGPAPRAEYFHGDRARLLKYQNAAWMALLYVGVYLICRQLGLSFWPALAGALASNLLLLSSQYRLYLLDSLMTESAAAALLTIGSFLLARAVASRSIPGALLAGLCFGLLTLVKAAALYITLALAIGLPLVAWLMRRPLRVPLMQAAAVVGLMAVVVLPWMMRNQASVGFFALAGRGGEVAHNRAVMDQMTNDELIGAIYAWAPYPLNGPIRRVLGYSRTDLQAGGRLQRLNDYGDTAFAASDQIAEHAGHPEQAVSFYRKGRAEMFALINQYRAEGNPQPYMSADTELKRRAMQIFLKHPLRHAALTVLSLWRSAAVCFPVLTIALICALRRRADDVTILVLPALLMVMLHAVVSYYEPRYSLPAYPIVICLLIFGAQQVIQRRQVSANTR